MTEAGRASEARRASEEEHDATSLARRASSDLHREALPWWSFAIAGGLLTVWLGRQLFAGQFGLPGAETAEGVTAPLWLSWLLMAAFFLPGGAAGSALGWCIIRPVNLVLGWLFVKFNYYFDRMSAGYAFSVGGLLRVSALVLVVYGGLLALTFVVFRGAPTGFIPEQDQGRFTANIQLPDSASLERTEAVVAEVQRIARGDPHDCENYPGIPGIAHTVAFAGSSSLLGANSSNFASMYIVLDPFDKRRTAKLSASAIMDRLYRVCRKKVPDAKFTVSPASAIPGLSAGGFKFVVEDCGGLGPAELQQRTDELVKKVGEEVHGVNNVMTQFRSNTPQLFLDIDRDKTASLGVALGDVNQTLDTFMGSSYVNSFNDFGRHWQVTLQAEGDYRNRVEDLNLFQVRNQFGQMVPLGTLVRPADVTGPIAYPRYNLYLAAAVSGKIDTGTSTGEVITKVDNIALKTLPPTMTADWTELMFLQKRVGDTSLYVFFLAIISVFLALSALYESWTLPLAVILVVPLCLLCSVEGTLLVGTGRRTSSCRSAWWCWWGWPARTRSWWSNMPSSCTGNPVLRVRAARRSRPRRRHRGCGCGRSS